MDVAVPEPFIFYKVFIDISVSRLLWGLGAVDTRYEGVFGVCSHTDGQLGEDYFPHYDKYAGARQSSILVLVKGVMYCAAICAIELER